MGISEFIVASPLVVLGIFAQNFWGGFLSLSLLCVPIMAYLGIYIRNFFRIAVMFVLGIVANDYLGFLVGLNSLCVAVFILAVFADVPWDVIASGLCFALVFILGQFVNGYFGVIASLNLFCLVMIVILGFSGQEPWDVVARLPMFVISLAFGIFFTAHWEVMAILLSAGIIFVSGISAIDFFSDLGTEESTPTLQLRYPATASEVHYRFAPNSKIPSPFNPLSCLPMPRRQVDKDDWTTPVGWVQTRVREQHPSYRQVCQPLSQHPGISLCNSTRKTSRVSQEQRRKDLFFESHEHRNAGERFAWVSTQLLRELAVHILQGISKLNTFSSGSHPYEESLELLISTLKHVIDELHTLSGRVDDRFALLNHIQFPLQDLEILYHNLGEGFRSYNSDALRGEIIKMSDMFRDDGKRTISYAFLPTNGTFIGDHYNSIAFANNFGQANTTNFGTGGSGDGSWNARGNNVDISFQQSHMIKAPTNTMPGTFIDSAGPKNSTPTPEPRTTNVRGADTTTVNGHIFKKPKTAPKSASNAFGDNATSATPMASDPFEERLKKPTTSSANPLLVTGNPSPVTNSSETAKGTSPSFFQAGKKPGSFGVSSSSNPIRNNTGGLSSASTEPKKKPEETTVPPRTKRMTRNQGVVTRRS